MYFALCACVFLGNGIMHDIAVKTLARLSPSDGIVFVVAFFLPER